MRVWRKFTAVALVFVMALAMSATALAEPVTTNGSTLGKGTNADTDPLGEQGSTGSTISGETVTLAKEITAYNPETATVKAPTVSYSYTIAPTSVSSLTVNDGTTTGPVHEGVGTPTISGPVAWTTSDDLSASSAGVANFKTFTVDFSGVNFGGPGVFRYTITEALTTDYTYDSSGVTQTSDATNGHTRYLDVYVKAASGYTGTGGANDWDVYGFTCFYNNESITPSNKATSAVKTTGFVAGTTGGDNSVQVTADSYYTYNLTVSKTVANDTYGAATYKFPFTVIMSNSDITKNVSIVVSTAKVNGEDNAVATAENFVGTNNLITGTFAATNAFEGVLKIKHNTAVTYTGIPCGTDIEVYETNVFSGITYSAVTSVDGTSRQNPDILTEATAATITNLTGNSPTVAAQGDSASTGQSTKATFTTTANEAQSSNHSVAIVNTLVNISPTGVTLRYAPYLAMLGAGVVALPLSIRRKREDLF